MVAALGNDRFDNCEPDYDCLAEASRCVVANGDLEAAVRHRVSSDTVGAERPSALVLDVHDVIRAGDPVRYCEGHDASRSERRVVHGD